MRLHLCHLLFLVLHLLPLLLWRASSSPSSPIQGLPEKKLVMRMSSTRVPTLSFSPSSSVLRKLCPGVHKNTKHSSNLPY